MLIALGHKDGLVAAQLLVVVKRVLLVLRLRLPTHVLASDMLHNVAHIVVLPASQFSAPSDDHFVSASAKVFLVVNEEVLASLQPQVDLGPVAIV